MDSQNAVQAEIPIQPANQFSRSPIFLGLLVFLLLLSFSFLGYQNMQLQKQIESMQTLPSATTQPNPDSTANWKTYTNTKYGFEFKYPEDWSTPTFSIVDTKELSLYGSGGQINIYLVENLGGACEAGYQKINLGGEMTDTCHTKDADGAEVFDQISVQFKKQPIDAFLGLHIYSVTRNSITGVTSQDTTIIRKILSTFKLTN